MNKFQFKSAVANQDGAMEADTISKNGRNSKNQTSRREFLSYLAIAAVSAAFTSCGGGSGSGGRSSSKIKITTESNQIEFNLVGSGVATVDWGDDSEKVSLTLEGYLRSFRHTYPNASIRTITINGDNITELWNSIFITGLDVSRCKELTKLDCSRTGIISNLDVSKNTALTELVCYDNKLSSLDVSKCTVLTSLSCSGNKLTSSALNTLFGTLHSNAGEKNIWISGNPGAETCDRSIAERKGWLVH